MPTRRQSLSATPSEPRSGVSRGSTIARLLGSGIREAEATLIGGGDIPKPWPNSSRCRERAYLRRPVFVAGEAAALESRNRMVVAGTPRT